MERKTRDDEAFSIVCHNFSDIRRRPLVIGKLDQVRLPFVVTMPQLAVGALTFGLLFLTRPLWGAVMSDRLHIVVFVVTPIVVAQQVSRTSIEGRTVSKAALGFLRLWLAPRHGELNGHRRRPAADRAIRLSPLVPVAISAPVPQGGGDQVDPAEAPRPSRPSRPAGQRVSRRTERRHQREALA
jgi:hypothetical protein